MDQVVGLDGATVGHPLLAGLHAATPGLATAARAGRDRVSLLSDEDTRAALDAVKAIQAMSTACWPACSTMPRCVGCGSS